MRGGMGNKEILTRESDAKHTVVAWFGTTCIAAVPVVGILRGLSVITTTQLFVLYGSFVVAYTAWFVQRRRSVYGRILSTRGNEGIECLNQNCDGRPRIFPRKAHRYLPGWVFENDIALEVTIEKDDTGRYRVCPVCYRRIVGKNIRQASKKDRVI